MPLYVSSTCAHHQEVKIALHGLWYHHAYRWPSRAQVRITFWELHRGTANELPNAKEDFDDQSPFNGTMLLTGLHLKHSFLYN